MDIGDTLKSELKGVTMFNKKLFRVRTIFALVSLFALTGIESLGAREPIPVNDPSQLMGPVGLSTLDQRMQMLTGRIEELEHHIQVLHQRMDEMSTWQQAQVSEKQEASLSRDKKPKDKTQQDRESGKNSSEDEKSDLTPDVKSRDTAQETSANFLPEGSVQERYDHICSLIASASYGQAEKSLKEFLKFYGDHTLTPNAIYLLGEVYFVQDKLDKALATFAQGYKSYSASAKGPDMLLKIAMCLSKQEKKKEACVALGQLKSSHKVVSQGVAQSSEKLRANLECSQKQEKQAEKKTREKSEEHMPEGA